MADPTADLRQQLADHEADKDKRDTKCFSNLGDCRGLSKEARRWNQGSSQLTVWQWLTRAHRVFKNRQNKKEAGKVQTKANTANTSGPLRALLLRRCGCGLAYNRMWVWFRAHALYKLESTQRV